MARDFIPSDHFKLFAKQVEVAIANASSQEMDQKKQVMNLISLEIKFRKELNSHAAGRKVYKDFIEFITVKNKNILSARPYFRERQKFFTKYISPAFKKNDPKAFQNFRVNFLFIQFAMNAYAGPEKKKVKLLALFEAIKKQRNVLIEINMPLGINRAKLFWRKVPKIDLDYMDIVQLAGEGLMSAVDKFVPPYRTAFRAVAIGRMIGNMIEASSSTLLHFYPSDKRMLYQANIARFRKKLETIEEITASVNAAINDNTKTIAPDEMNALMLAASHISVELAPKKKGDMGSDSPDAEVNGMYKSFLKMPDDAISPEQEVEDMQMSKKIKIVFETVLSPIQRKLLILKGEYCG